MEHDVSVEAVRAVVDKGVWPVASRRDVDLALTGRMTDALREAILRDLTVAGTQARMDAVSAAVLAHRGINPAVLYAICIHATDAEVNDASGMQVASLGSDGYCHVRLDAPNGPDWRTMGGHLGRLPRIPHSAALLAEGRPLREIASHPALDSLDLIVRRVEDVFDHSSIILEDVPWLETEALTRFLETENATCG